MKTIEINNKHYINAKVHLLDTGKIGMKGEIVRNKQVSAPHQLFIADIDCTNITQHHIHITSSEEIKEGDWYLILIDNTIMKANINSDHKDYDCKKIIATTDKSLRKHLKYLSEYEGKYIDKQLPQLSNEFIESYIEQYNKGNIIENILVEVEYKWEDKLNEKSYLKLTDNTINIHKALILK